MGFMTLRQHHSSTHGFKQANPRLFWQWEDWTSRKIFPRWYVPFDG